ncbi:MarR family transcriptional regulator [Fusobacterium mortiferum]|uniref:MarR family transcriptional regulator n=1 Tax=Fusobacterium mortiferum TaxID=850 RepID=A0ABS2FZ68_FUSMR|nr:MarR family transcriptional regulator [Fusobacterium mortiferum]MBM6874434.1 MarR family transcriptional regulator [Fusobacterium mortiferum]
MELSYHYLLLLNHSIYQKKMYEAIENLKLSIGQPKVFDFLKDHDGCIQKEIAVGCQIEPASVTSILLTMEKRGFIERRSINENRRSHYVFLTEEGKRIANLVREAMLKVEEQVLENFTIEEKELLIKLLKKANYNLLGDTFIKEEI